LATEFRLRNRLGMASVIPRKKVLIPRFREEPILGFGKEENGIQKISFTKNPPLGRNFESLLLFFPTEGNFEHFPPLGNGSERNSKSFLFHGVVQNGIPRVSFYFCSMVQNSEHSSPLCNGSERNSESFLFRGTAGKPEFRRNKPIVPSIPSSTGIIFFVGNCQP
jgi:hypothetical protein